MQQLFADGEPSDFILWRDSLQRVYWLTGTEAFTVCQIMVKRIIVGTALITQGLHTLGMSSGHVFDKMLCQESL